MLIVGLILAVALEIINLRTAYWTSVKAKVEGEVSTFKPRPFPDVYSAEDANNERQLARAKRLAEIAAERAALKKQLSELKD